MRYRAYFLMNKSIFLLFILLFANFNLSSAVHEIQFQVQYNKRDDAAINKISRVSKMFNNDNKFIESSIVEFDCNKQNEKTGFCTTDANAIHLTIKCMKTYRSVFKIVPEALYHDLRDITIELLFSFSKRFYTETALGIQSNSENWWLNVGLISNNLLDSEEALIETISKGKSSYSFILYVMSDDFLSFEAAIHFHHALQSTKSPGGIVDCKHHADVCEKNSIESNGHPVLLAYYEKERYQTYESEYSGEQIKDWIRTIQQPVIADLTEKIVPEYRSGIIPGFDKTVDTVTMLFTADKKDAFYKNFRKFARENHGKYHFGQMVNPEISKWAHNPALVTVKPHDEYMKAITLYEDLSYTSMLQYLEDGLRPAIHIIENSRDFLYALSARQPLVIFYDPTKTKKSEQFDRLANTHEVRTEEAVFGSIKGYSLFGMFLAENLIPEFLRPNYIMLEKAHGDMHLSLCVRSKLISDETSRDIHIWLKNVKQEKCTADIDPYVTGILEKIALYERMEEVRKAISNEEKHTTHSHESIEHEEL